MRRLRRRVQRVGGNHKEAMARYAPVPAGGAIRGGGASPIAADVMPQALITVYPQPGAGYSTIAYRGLSPIFTASGEAVPATSPGRWGQLKLAGRP